MACNHFAVFFVYGTAVCVDINLVVSLIGIEYHPVLITAEELRPDDQAIGEHIVLCRRHAHAQIAGERKIIRIFYTIVKVVRIRIYVAHRYLCSIILKYNRCYTLFGILRTKPKTKTTGLLLTQIDSPYKL